MHFKNKGEITMFNNSLSIQPQYEGTTIIYAYHNGTSVEVTRENFKHFLEKNAYFFRKVIPYDLNVSAPMDIRCSESEVAQWLAQNTVSSINTSDTAYYAYIDGVKICPSIERLDILQKRNTTFTKQSIPNEGYINPIEEVMCLNDILIKAVQVQTDAKQQIQASTATTSLVTDNNIDNVIVAEKVDVKKSCYNKLSIIRPI